MVSMKPGNKVLTEQNEWGFLLHKTQVPEYFIHTHMKYGTIFFCNKKQREYLCREKTWECGLIQNSVHCLCHLEWRKHAKLGKFQEGAAAMAGRWESHYSWRRVKYLAAFVWLSKKLKEDMTGVCKCIRQETGKQLNKAMEQGWQMEKQFMLR